MSERDNTNSGALFINDRKTKENHPGWTGTINANGVEFWVSGWVREIQGGKRQGQKMVSLALTPKDGGSTRNITAGGPGPENDYDDDIPFTPNKDTMA